MSITFDRNAFNSVGGQKCYWMVSWLRSETPNGTYYITKRNSRHWTIQHEQVINGGEAKIVRTLGMATTREVAIRYAESDETQLAEKVLDALLKRPAHLTVAA